MSDGPFDPTPDAARYAGLLGNVAPHPPTLMGDLLEAVGHPALRAYPMLTAHGATWSVRLEGLQVGVVGAGQGWLDVGKIGTTGQVGPQRTHWLARTGWGTPYGFTVADLKGAVEGLQKFAGTWIAPVGAPDATVPQQDEHALESRILRGSVRSPSKA